MEKMKDHSIDMSNQEITIVDRSLGQSFTTDKNRKEREFKLYKSSQVQEQ